MYYFKGIISLLVIAASLELTFVNFISNLSFTNKDKTIRARKLFSNSLSVVPFTDSFIVKDFVSILKCYEEFIECNNNYKVVVVNYIIIDIDTSHNALALDEAQIHITEDIGVSDIDVNKFKETKHIIKAVSITIYTNLKELVANAIIIPKYFSRDVYYEIGCTIIIDSEKLYREFCLEKIASSSYGIVKSVSLGLTLVVV